MSATLPTGLLSGPEGADNPMAVLARISRQLSTAAANMGMAAALPCVVLLDVLSSMSGSLVSMPVCAASRRNLVKVAG